MTAMMLIHEIQRQVTSGADWNDEQMLRQTSMKDFLNGHGSLLGREPQQIVRHLVETGTEFLQGRNGRTGRFADDISEVPGGDVAQFCSGFIGNLA